jgi:hypothetical protein
MKSTVLKCLCWPLFLGSLVALVVHALWGASGKWEDGVFITTLSDKSWPMRSWYKNWGGTCFGYGIMLAPGTSDITLRHEKVHVEQNESGSVGGLMLGLLSLVTVHSWWGLATLVLCWIGTPWFVYIGASLVAWLHGNSAYMGNNLEEAARNAADR